MKWRNNRCILTRNTKAKDTYYSTILWLPQRNQPNQQERKKQLQSSESIAISDHIAENPRESMIP